MGAFSGLLKDGNIFGPKNEGIFGPKDGDIFGPTHERAFRAAAICLGIFELDFVYCPNG